MKRTTASACLLILSSILTANSYAADSETDKKMSHFFNALTDQSVQLSKLNLEKSPGLIVSVLARSRFKNPIERNQIDVAFQYIDTRSNVQQCSGQTLQYVNGALYDYWGKERPSKAVIDYAVKNNTFIAATSDRYCSNDNYNNSLENLNNKLSISERSVLIEDSESILTRKNALSISSRLTQFLNARRIGSHELKDLKLQLTHTYNNSNSTVRYYYLYMTVKGSTEGIFGGTKTLSCDLLISTKYETYTSGQGRPYTSYEVKIAPSAAGITCHNSETNELI